MLVFVIPLKSLQASKSWDHVSQLFERCIKSVCNQTSPKFKAIVVCHEKPEIDFQHSQITYIKVDYPAPDFHDKGDQKRDKVRKIFLGLHYAQNLGLFHAMNVDADDCVSKHLAKFVEQNSQENGWFVNKGYLFKDGSKIVYFKWKGFNRFCGTSNILRHDLLDLPENLPDSIKDYPSIRSKYTAHHVVAQKLARQEIPIKPLPFPGATYIIGHQDSDSSSAFDKLVPPKSFPQNFKRIVCNYRPLTSSVRNEFGIYDIP